MWWTLAILCYLFLGIATVCYFLRHEVHTAEAAATTRHHQNVVLGALGLLWPLVHTIAVTLAVVFFICSLFGAFSRQCYHWFRLEPSEPKKE